jgi:hypothetical protein
MKLTYQRPETELIIVSTVRMIAGSNPEDGFNPDDVEETQETSGNLSRRRNVWDDEEEEEEEF